MSVKFKYNDIAQLTEIANKILEYTFPRKKFAFYGDMGVGKTTLIKQLSLHVGVVDLVSSPTFSIVNEYNTKSGRMIYHFDFYRLKNEKEAFDIGYEEYFFGNEYCFIEWPEKISNLISSDIVKVKMYIDQNYRIIEIVDKNGKRKNI